MNRKKIVKGIVITTLGLTLISAGSYRLIKGRMSNDKYQKIVNEHVSNNEHSRNIVAHRGFSSMALDNSQEAIRLASESPCVNMIEIDISKTRDGFYVLYHDILINIDGGIYLFNMADYSLMKDKIINESFLSNIDSIEDCFSKIDGRVITKRLFNDLKSNGTLITIDEFINNYNFSKTIVFDLKFVDDDMTNFYKKLDLLLPYSDKVIIQGKNAEMLLQMKKKYPQFCYLLIIDETNDFEDISKEFDGYTVKQNYLDRIMIDDKKMYLIWLINSINDYQELLEKDNFRHNMYIVTDNPDIICNTICKERVKGKMKI